MAMSSLMWVFHCMLLPRVLSQEGLQGGILEGPSEEIKKMFLAGMEQQKFLDRKTKWRQGKISTLTDDNFDSVINKHANVLVAFTAPSCQGCRQWLLNDFQKISDKLVGEEPPVFCGKVSAEVEKELAQSLHVQIEDFPQLILFKNKQDFRDIHPSHMSVKGVIRWVNEKLHTQPDLHVQGVKSLSSLSDVTNFIKTRKEVVLGFFNGTIPQAWLNVAKGGIPQTEHDKHVSAPQTFVFAFTTTPEVHNFYGITPPGMMLFLNAEEGFARYTADINSEAQIIHFVQSYKGRPILDWRGSETIFALREAGRPALFLLASIKEVLLTEKTKKNFQTVALRLNRRLISVIVPMKAWHLRIEELEPIFNIKMTQPGGGELKKDDYPNDMIAIVENMDSSAGERRVFKMKFDEESGFYTEEAIEAFVQDYMADNLPEFAKNDL